MKLIAILICYLAGNFLSSMASAQSEIELRVLNPSGFVAPGDQAEIIAEIRNPIDSEFTIERISGGGGGRRSTLFESAIDPRSFQLQMLSRVRRPGVERYRLVSGAFPVQPGEAIQIVLAEIQIPPNAPLGATVELTQLSVTLDSENSRLPSQVYADLNVMRIISADGGGDLAQFEQIDLVNPQAGMLHAQLLAEFTYPQQVIAGESFDMQVSITNRANNAVEINYPAIGEMASMLSWQGDHSRSYRFIPCTTDCLIAGTPELEKGDSLTLRLGTFHYENADFFDGSLILDEFMLNVFDRLGRHESVIAIADPIYVAVVYRPGTEAIYKSIAPQSERLLQRDLNNPGDGLVIYDPNTGHEWLKLTASKGRTLEQMLADSQPGGVFEGFSLASSTQVEELILNHMNSMGESLKEYALYSPFVSVEPVQALVGLLGNIPTANNTLGFNGIVNDALPENTNANAEYTIMEVSVTSAAASSGAIFRSSAERLLKYKRKLDNRFVEYTGYWMVR